MASVPSGSLGSLRHGLQSLPKQIHNLLGEKVITGATIHKINYIPNVGWESILEKKSGQLERIHSKTLLLTVPAYEASALFLSMGMI